MKDWTNFYKVDKEINDRIAFKMYRALHTIVEDQDMRQFMEQRKDLSKLFMCLNAIDDYKQSYTEGERSEPIHHLK